MSTPGEAGDLWVVSGISGNAGNQGRNWRRPLAAFDQWRSDLDHRCQCCRALCIGFGAAAPGQSYPAVYMVGWVKGVYGIWQSVNEAQSWTQIGTWPNGSLDQIKTISGDPNVFGKVYVGFAGSGYAYLSADSSGTDVLQTDSGPPARPNITGFARDGRSVYRAYRYCKADSTVTIYDNGTAIGSATANAQGKWSYTTGRMPTGAALFTATATDAEGTSSQSLQSKYRPIELEQLQAQLGSERAAFAFDFPTLGYSPNCTRQGAYAFSLRGRSKRRACVNGQLYGVEFSVKKRQSRWRHRHRGRGRRRESLTVG